jgi:PKD repeat protein
VVRKNTSTSRIFKGNSIWIAFYATYLVFILLSAYVFIAQDSVDDIRNNMEESYTYKLTFKADGRTTHYDVTRHDTNTPGKITLVYWTEDNKLDITDVSNIRTLKIDVDSMFKDEVLKVFKRTESAIPSMYHDYWYEAGDGIFTIEFDIAVNEPMESLTFTKFPTPVSVLVDHHDVVDEEWWGGTDYTISGESITITDIPTGETTVVIYFKGANQPPVAAFTTVPEKFAGVYEDIIFNGSTSYDRDAEGKIVDWIWDFGDSNFESGMTTMHNYSSPGNYTVRLTVRDDAEPPGENWIEKILTIAFGAEEDNDNDGLSDLWEWDNFQDLQYDQNDDPDKDGFVNGLEYLAETDPTNNTDNEEDSDSDGLTDKWEWEHFYSLDEDKHGDPDKDGKTNEEEETAGSDPTEDDAPDKGKDKEPAEFDYTLAILAVVIVVVVLVVVMFIFRSKKAKEEKAKDDEAIAAMEEKIKRAKKLGLPTGELEKILREAKEGKPLTVEPEVVETKTKKGGKGQRKAKTGTKGKGTGKGRTGTKSKRRR